MFITIHNYQKAENCTSAKKNILINMCPNYLHIIHLSLELAIKTQCYPNCKLLLKELTETAIKMKKKYLNLFTLRDLSMIKKIRKHFTLLVQIHRLYSK